MEKLAYTITDRLLRHGVIPREDYEIYVYGYAVLLEQLLQVTGFAVLGLVTGNLANTGVFLLTFYLLRSSFGGYHAETSLRCMLLSYGGWAVVMTAADYVGTMDAVPVSCWILLILDIVVFAVIGPVAHANKPLNAAQKRRYKRNGFVVLVICSSLAFLFRHHAEAGMVYIGTTAFVAILALLGKRKEKNYEED